MTAVDQELILASAEWLVATSAIVENGRGEPYEMHAFSFLDPDLARTREVLGEAVGRADPMAHDVIIEHFGQYGVGVSVGSLILLDGDAVRLSSTYGLLRLNEEATPPTVGAMLLADWLATRSWMYLSPSGTYRPPIPGTKRLAGRPLEREALAAFPIPIFGSPPHDFQPLGSLLGGAGTIAATGTAYVSDHPVLAVCTAVGSAIVWLTKPSAEEVREGLAARVRRKMALPGDGTVSGGPTVEDPPEGSDDDR